MTEDCFEAAGSERNLAGASGGFRVLAPDLAGRACNNTVTGPWGIGRHAEDVIAIADAAGAETVTLLGHSMGAYVADTVTVTAVADCNHYSIMFAEHAPAAVLAAICGA